MPGTIALSSNYCYNNVYGTNCGRGDCFLPVKRRKQSAVMSGIAVKYE
jgi:hypothetical protein